MDGRDHDTLVEIVQILKNHVDNFNNHVERFEKHLIDDRANFDKVIQETKGVKEFQNRIIGGLLTASIIVQIIVGVFHK